ncbi:MAG: hypothetical protein ACJAS9_003432 [Polaribacter sp.]|jgi:hypothetical protein
MNDGQVNKIFHVFGSKSKEVLNQFTEFKKNRFYLDHQLLVDDCYCEFIVIDTSEIKGENLNLWVEGKVLSEHIITLIVDDKQYLSGESLITYPLKLGGKFETFYVFKNHGELVSVLEALSELQNGFSLVEIDIADFMYFLSLGQHFWSDIIYSQSIDELKLKIVEKLENVKARAKNNGLTLSRLFGCIKGINNINVSDEYELIMNTLKELEPRFYCEPAGLLIHTNMVARTNRHEKSEGLGFHMLWGLTDSETVSKRSNNAKKAVTCNND